MTGSNGKKTTQALLGVLINKMDAMIERQDETNERLDNLILLMGGEYRKVVNRVSKLERRVAAIEVSAGLTDKK